MEGPAWDYARANDVSDWKDDEFGYCCALVMRAGNKSVPRESVSSYLNVQRISALCDGRKDVAAKLATLAASWEATRP